MSASRLPDLRAVFDGFLTSVTDACRHYYGQRLTSLAVFGSVGRGTPRPDSDIDFLIVGEPLPDGRMARVEEFGSVEVALEPAQSNGRPVDFTANVEIVFRLT